MKKGLLLLFASTLCLRVSGGEIVILQQEPSGSATEQNARRAASEARRHSDADDTEALGDYLGAGAGTPPDNARDQAREARHYSAGERPPPVHGGVVIETTGRGETLILTAPAVSNDEYSRLRARQYVRGGPNANCNAAESLVGHVEGDAGRRLEVNASQKGGGTSASKDCH